jgi:ribosomal protein S18 acetylase RimI-like enzyme
MPSRTGGARARRIAPELTWAIVYREDGLAHDEFARLARNAGQEESQVASAAALAHTVNISAWHGDMVVGVGRLLSDGSRAVIADLLVDPEHRGLGIATELTRRMLSRAPLGEIALGVPTASSRLFEHMGAVRTSRGFILRRS